MTVRIIQVFSYTFGQKFKPMYILEKKNLKNIHFYSRSETEEILISTNLKKKFKFSDNAFAQDIVSHFVLSLSYLFKLVLCISKEKCLSQQQHSTRTCKIEAKSRPRHHWHQLRRTHHPLEIA